MINELSLFLVSKILANPSSLAVPNILASPHAFYFGDEHDLCSGVLLVEAKLGVSLDVAHLDVQLND